MPSIVYLNGQFLARPDARLSVDERGFFFGDGVYEVTRAVRGSLFEWDRHAARLTRGLRELRISCDISMEEFRELQLRLLSENDLQHGEATVYLQVTRGAAPRTHRFPPAGTPPTVFLSATGFSPPHDKRATGVAAVTHPDYRWSRCDLKTVNLLPAVMANQYATDKGAFEALFVRDLALTEGSHTNVFGVIGGVLRTYPSSNYVLPGVTRDVVVEIAHSLGVPVSETPVFTHEFPMLEECFLTGTTSDVMPVVSIDGVKVGDGKPGPTSMRLYRALAERLDEVGGSVTVAAAVALR